MKHAPLRIRNLTLCLEFLEAHGRLWLFLQLRILVWIGLSLGFFPNSPIVSTKIEIFHTGYSSPEVNSARRSRNLRILETMTTSSSESHPMGFS